MFKKKTVLVIEFTKLPKEIREFVKEAIDWRFHNDTLIEWNSEMSPMNGKTWDKSLSLNEIKEYHKDQVKTNGYEGDFDQFVVKYGLVFDMWLLDKKADLAGVEEIYIDICW